MSPWKSMMFMRSVAVVVIITFGGMVTSPAVAAMQLADETQSPTVPQVQDDEATRHSAAVVQAREELRALAGRPDVNNRVASLDERRAARDRLKALRTELRELDTRTRAEFVRVGNLVANKNLPPVIVARHAEALAEYDARANALFGDLDVIETSDEPAAFEHAEAAFERLNALELERGHQPFDPENLPNRSLQPLEGNEPKLTPEEFLTVADTLDLSRALAANEDFDLSGLIGANEAAYLAPTTEVVLSVAINAKAAELNHDPVQIYNWVRNNVEWQPYWGAVQNADLTLSAERGTAMDIASLTIALLRASGIPARYVHGTIELPEDEFRNWVGGFEHINAAIEFAASGGIPIAGVTSGGTITKVRMQHIWVEAALDFAPSRAAVNRAADSWVALDPSFKQYEFLDGLDPIALAGLDPEELADAFLASGTLNEQEGWVAGFDPAVIESAQQIASQALADYIAVNLPGATVGDVLGGRRIIGHAASALAGTLATEVLAAGASYASLPDSLRQHILFGVGAEYSVRMRWADVNNRKITLSFKPATSVDEAALLALLPAGEITDITQLPSSIPTYLIQVRPELKVSGNLILAGEAMRLGEEIRFTQTLELAGGRIGAANPYNVIAGSYVAVSANAGDIAPIAATDSKVSINATRAIIESDDPQRFDLLSREQLLGDMFHAGLIGYYAQYILSSYVSGLRQGGHHYLAGGIGSYGYEPQVHTVLGMPMAVRGGGFVMNLPILNVFGYDQNDSSAGHRARLNFITEIGLLSSTLEHGIPEQMFVTEETPGQAISAVRALEIASASGQKIYRITSMNRNDVLPNLVVGDQVRSDISAALAGGREVLVHSSPISVPGWSGTGYIILDPIRGDGAYKVSGGLNGGILSLGSIMSTVFTINFTFKGALATVAGSGSIGKIFDLLGRYTALVGFAAGVGQIMRECAGDGARPAILFFTIASVIAIAATGASVALGPFGPFLVGLVLGPVVDNVKSRLLNSAMCGT